ncbi:polysaccharide chain length determinant protein [Klebsiella phage VLCpiA2a]|nr:polysaccharide chain length determinant protein [Klebsiella phage VLCpiA2a]UVX31910.1 polysaccharide chain length determinant protein [Klebsiella phage VLCpiA2a]UVX32002.1 polysaccharide chain length determinant protein [Klebsiella phage VLCpiA2b]
MSLINTYVSVSQFFRKVGTSIRKKLISKLEAELFRTEIDLAKAEEKRSENMVKLHQDHYKAAAAIGEQKAAELDALYKKFDDLAAAEVSRFTVAKASIAVVSQAIADDLKSRRAALSSELDKLVG